MTSRIQEILEVLHEIWIRRPAIRAIRSRATREVASRHKIRPASVHTKFARELEPEVGSLDAFDNLVMLWMGGDCERLKEALSCHGDSADRKAIDEFFMKHSPRPLHG